MNRENIRERLLVIVSDFTGFPASEINTSERFRLSVKLDSFGLITMMNTVEDEFGISIPDDNLRSFRTIDDIISWLEANT